MPGYVRAIRANMASSKTAHREEGESLTLEEGGRPDSDWRESDDRAIEESLYRRAQGYDVEETIEEDSEKYGRKTRVTTHHIPGDVRAQIFWLKNRKPDAWTDKPEADRRQEEVNLVDDIP